MTRSCASPLVLRPLIPALVLFAFLGVSAPGQGDPRSPLSGPRVEDQDVPGVPSTFAGRESATRMSDRVRPRLFMEAVRSLREESVPPSQQLSDDQLAAIQAVERSLRRKQKAWRSENAEEITRLRSGAESGDDSDRRALRRFMARAPRPDGAQAEIWSLLTEEQREHVRGFLDARTGMTDEMQDRETPLARRAGEETELLLEDRARFEVLWERLEQMPVAQRDRVLIRLERALERSAAASDQPQADAQHYS